MLIQLKMIRNRLLKEGRFSKYVFYAIGEIFLVVAGILIALEVNNYNQEQQLKSVERHYYQTMQVQLSEDKGILEIEMLAVGNRISDYLQGIVLISQNDRQHADNLNKVVYRLLEYGDFRRKSSVYQTLVNSGEIKHINNKAIIASIQELERTYEITERLENTQANVVMLHAAPAVSMVLDFETVKITDPDLIYTSIFKNRFSIAIRLAKEKQQQFEHALTVIDATLMQIDSELKRR